MVLLWVRGAVSIIQVPMRGSGTKMEIEKEGQKSVERRVLMMQAKQSKQEQFVSPLACQALVYREAAPGTELCHHTE